MMNKTELRKFLQARLPVKVYEKGESIFLQGGNADGCYYQMSGLSRSFIVSDDGNERCIVTNLPGALFGASSYFSGSKRRSSARAMTNCEIIHIRGHQLSEFIQSEPAFTEALLRGLSGDVNHLIDQLSESKLYPSDKNVARFLCRCVKSGQYVTEKNKACIEFPQNAIAESLGVSRWTVNRAYTGMRKKGWITTGYEKLIINDYAALSDYAGEL